MIINMIKLFIFVDSNLNKLSDPLINNNYRLFKTLKHVADDTNNEQIDIEIPNSFTLNDIYLFCQYYLLGLGKLINKDKFKLVNDYLGFITKNKQFIYDDQHKIIPLKTTYLIINDQYFGKIPKDIPNSVTHLKIGKNTDINRYEYESCRLILKTLHYLFSSAIDKRLTNDELTLSSDYIASTFDRNKIPDSVTHLFFSKGFLKNIDHFIPSTVTHLIFEGAYYVTYLEPILDNISYLEINGFLVKY